MATLGTLALGALGALGTSGAAAALRPPAVPLVTHDPYFSAWSVGDRLYDDWPKHWTGANHAMCGIIRVDGVPMRFMGGANALTATVQQTGLKVTATQSSYTFAAGPVSLTATFTSPLLADDLDILSRPASYVTFATRSRDGQRHDVALYFDISAEWAVDTTDQTVEWGRASVPRLATMRLGTVAQNVLGRAGDNLRIDWGRLYLVVPEGEGVSTVIGSADDLRRQFCEAGTLPASDDAAMPRAANDRWPVLTARLDLGSVGGAPVTRHLTVAYDDVYGIEYMKKPLRAWWRRDAGMTPERMLAQAEAEYNTLMSRCAAFDARLAAEAARAGGLKYADLCTLVYRQTIAAHKLVAGPVGEPLFFSKENFSNGCIGTVDVTYPSAPFFLHFNPELLKAQIVPVLRYALSPAWPFPFAPHDLGTYPKANGQVYGLAGDTLQLESQMPVEECGNMLIMAAALAQAEKSTAWAHPYWPVLSKWAVYLTGNGLDPTNQLCTADMFGHMAHNADLSLKAIIGIGAYATLCRMDGRADEAEKNMATARDYAAKWRQMAQDTGRTRLAFDRPGTWGMKHNLIWDRVLGLNLFPEEVGDEEATWYKGVQGPFGLPCDSRTSQSLIDWAVWCAALARDRDDFESLVAPLHRYVNETPSRVPVSDWFDTGTGRQVGFQARSVVGGVYIKMLKPPATAMDVTRSARIAAGLVAPTPDEAYRADVYPAGAPDGIIDLRDAANLAREQDPGL